MNRFSAAAACSTAYHRSLADPEADAAPSLPDAAIYVQKVDVQCVLQFTLLLALVRPSSTREPSDPPSRVVKQRSRQHRLPRQLSPRLASPTSGRRRASRRGRSPFDAAAGTAEGAPTTPTDGPSPAAITFALFSRPPPQHPGRRRLSTAACAPPFVRQPGLSCAVLRPLR